MLVPITKGGKWQSSVVHMFAAECARGWEGEHVVSEHNALSYMMMEPCEPLLNSSTLELGGDMDLHGLWTLVQLW